MKPTKVSEAVIRRLPRYYRYLVQLDQQGTERISSSELSSIMRLNASQIRQDFNCFGGFGQQGYGYQVKSLLQEISAILTLDRHHAAIIVGAGNIGQALMCFEGFERQGFDFKALFDINPDLVGKEIRGRKVLHVDQLEEYIRENEIEIGVIAARRSAAQELADRMVNAGIKGIWNFAPIDVCSSVPVENVHLSDSLFVLAFKLGNSEVLF
ncbi:MAG: redox-sensing transcriptional repressor Rex [Clostridia bacterium]|nr:redox-sensing transcriptional repressor Rex [Clostridia bacterium]